MEGLKHRLPLRRSISAGGVSRSTDVLLFTQRDMIGS